jgi:hypothetical protein
MSHSDDHPFLHATRLDIPLGSRAIVAAAFWSGRIIRDTYDLVSTHNGLRDRTPRAAARPTRYAAPAV